ncbi:hypothetical protein [Klebsiella michiganensis]|uniref:hypothetical protein n=1 Tax=Klebsiella michiganensis TaxID=1134687 RepID=UPI001CCA6200|nr:hypothetical protein [Klebsiella michiganensis]
MSRMSRLQGEFCEIVGREVLRLSVSSAELSYEKLDAELINIAEESENDVEKWVVTQS